MFNFTTRCRKAMITAALAIVISTVASTNVAMARPVVEESSAPIVQQRGRDAPVPRVPPCGMACQGNETLETLHRYGWITERVLEYVCTTQRVLRSIPGAIIGLLTGRPNLSLYVITLCSWQWVTRTRWGRIN